MSRSRQQSLFDLTPEPAPAATGATGAGAADVSSEWEAAAEADRLAALVVFNRPLETAFHYLVPDSLRDQLTPGQRVRVPFGRGNRSTVGFCVGLERPPETLRRLKQIDSSVDPLPLVDGEMPGVISAAGARYLRR